MAKIVYVIPKQRVVLDDNISLDEAEELIESGDVDYEYDHIISDVEYDAYFEIEEN